MEHSSPIRRVTNKKAEAIIKNVDDESERLARRRSLVQKRQSTNNASDTGYEGPTLSEEETKLYFHHCVTLYVENKINAKNVWKLNIIQNLEKLSLPFQMVGTSLDLVAKIYGVKVDDTHLLSMKMASSLIQAQTKQRDEETNGDAEGDVSNAEASTEKKQKGKKPKYRKVAAGEKPTIAKDPETLCCPIKKCESYAFRPVGDSSSAIKNLFTSILPTDHSGHKFLFQGKNTTMVSKNDKDLIIEHNKSLPLSLPVAKNLQICEAFADFDVITWSMRDYDLEDEITPDKENEMVVFDSDGLPVPELDGSIYDVFQNNDEPEPMEQEEMVQDHITGNYRDRNVSKLLNIRPLTVRNTEYSYSTVVDSNSQSVLNFMWAGPSHWKLKSNRQFIARFSGKRPPLLQSERKRKRIMIKDIEADFDIPDTDLKKTAKVIKKNINHMSKVTLPMMEYIPRQIVNNVYAFMLKPVLTEMPRTRDKPEFENLDADNEACRNFDVNDSVDNQEAFEEDMPDNMDGLEQHQVADDAEEYQMIAAPQMVQKCNLNYVKKAKVMNMKKLKGAIWTIREEDYKLQKSQGKNDEPVTLYTMVMKELPKYLNDKMKSELSCPLAFFALLHLANEHNLDIKDCPSKDELYIRRAK